MYSGITIIIFQLPNNSAYIAKYVGTVATHMFWIIIHVSDLVICMDM